jgi:hypothetical protein
MTEKSCVSAPNIAPFRRPTLPPRPASKSRVSGGTYDVQDGVILVRR